MSSPLSIGATADRGHIEREALVNLELGGFRVRLVVEGVDASGLAAHLREQGSVAALTALVEAGVATYTVADGDPEVPEFGQTPEDPPRAVLDLSRRLRGGSAADRLERVRFAYRVGRLDGRLVSTARNGGRVYQEPSRLAPGANRTFFVVLNGAAGAPFWTADRSRYHELVRPDGVWVPNSVSRGLVSACELEAYTAGVGHPIPELD